MTNELDSLLQALEPEAAAAELPAGWCWGRPMDMCIGPPVAEFKNVQRGGRMVLAPTPESAKRLAAWAMIKWPILDRRSPEAVKIWQEHAAAVQRYQQELRAPRANTTNEAGEQPMPTLVRR